MTLIEQQTLAARTSEAVALPSRRPAYVDKMERRLGARYFEVLKEFLQAIAAHATSASSNKAMCSVKGRGAVSKSSGSHELERGVISKRLAEDVWGPLTALGTNCAIAILSDISDYREQTPTAESCMTVQQFAEQRLTGLADSHKKYAEAVVFIGDVLRDADEQSYPEWVLFGCWLLYRNVD